MGQTDQVLLHTIELDRVSLERNIIKSELNRDANQLALLRTLLTRRPMDMDIRGEFIRASTRLLIPELAFSEYQSIINQFGASLGDGYAAIKLLEEKRGDLALLIAPSYFGPHCQSIKFDADIRSGASHVQIELEPSGYNLTFSREFSMREMLFHRLMAMLRYIKALPERSSKYGKALLALDDTPEGNVPQLCFSACDGNVDFLVPDPDFLRTNGYRDVRAAYDAVSIPWADRRAELFWRGSLSGFTSSFKDIIELPRFRLSVMSSYGNLKNTNMRIVEGDFAQYADQRDEIIRLLSLFGALDRRVPIEENCKYRYLIDIDGNSNAWSGFFSKLMSGSSLLKLSSPFRQWYYDRVKDGEHVLYCGDVFDVGTKLAVLLNDDDHARGLSANAEVLAESMSPDSEFSVFLSAFERCVAVS